jgi:hypothetical protein
MNTEDRLRDALHGEAARIEPREGWANIESRLGEAVPRNRFRILSIAAAAVVLLAAGALVIRDDETPRPVVTNPGPTTSPPTTTAIPANGHGGLFIWPAGADGFPTPAAAGEAFARDFLTMVNPEVVTTGTEVVGSGANAEELTYVDVRPDRAGPPTHLVLPREASGWFVRTATADDLEVHSPAGYVDAIPDPNTLHITGKSIAFEGVVHVTVLALGSSLRCTGMFSECAGDTSAADGTGHALANTTFTGGGSEKTDFAVDVPLDRPYGNYGVLVLWTDSARDGSLAEATVRLIRLS